MCPSCNPAGTVSALPCSFCSLLLFASFYFHSLCPAPYSLPPVSSPCSILLSVLLLPHPYCLFSSLPPTPPCFTICYSFHCSLAPLLFLSSCCPSLLGAETRRSIWRAVLCPNTSRCFPATLQSHIPRFNLAVSMEGHPLG